MRDDQAFCPSTSVIVGRVGIFIYILRLSQMILFFATLYRCKNADKPFHMMTVLARIIESRENVHIVEFSSNIA